MPLGNYKLFNSKTKIDAYFLFICNYLNLLYTVAINLGINRHHHLHHHHHHYYYYYYQQQQQQ